MHSAASLDPQIAINMKTANMANALAPMSRYAPFVLIDGTYRSTVTLLSRFIYHWRSRCFDRHSWLVLAALARRKYRERMAS